jgi:hypothetical protein
LGQAQENPAVEASYGWFSGAKLKVSTTSALTIAEFSYKKGEGFTGKDLAMNTDPVPAADAQTRKIKDAFVPLAQKNVEWADQFGRNGALWIQAISSGLTAALHEVSLPAQVNDSIVALLATIERTKAAASQPAAKTETPPEPTQ